MEFRLVRVDLVAVGACSRDYATLIGDYERRVSRYTRYTAHELKGEPLQHGTERAAQIEGRRVAAALDAIERSTATPTTIVACDRDGHQLDTQQVASLFTAQPHLCLVIGGAAGLQRELLDRSDHTIAFGAITLPHQLARLVVVEQLYRSLRIARGEPYHH